MSVDTGQGHMPPPGDPPGTPKITEKPSNNGQKPSENNKPRGRGRPRKKPNTNKDDDVMSTDGSVWSGISTSNTYSGLTDDDEGNFVHVRRKKARATREKRPPPIVVPKLYPAQLEEKLKAAKIPGNNFRRKITREGTKLFVNTKEEFKVLKEHLQTNSIQNFTYTAEEDLTRKFLLKKLPDGDVDAIREELNKFGLNPVDIKKFKLRQPRYKGQMNYLLYFKKSDGITLNSLKATVTGLFHYLVSFEHYRPQITGPTHCRNCQSFGHSARNCNLTSYCLRCAGKHKTTECPHVDKETNKIPEEKVRCINCARAKLPDVYHTANYTKCPFRLELIQKRDERLNKIKQNERYVTLNKNSLTKLPRLPTSSSLTQPNISFSDTLKTNKNDTHGVLFSPTQLFQIFNDIIQISSQCHSKSEQIQALVQIYTKYAPNDY